MKYYWKVVRVHRNKKMVSAIVGDKRSVAVEYIEDTWVTPRIYGSKLMVFSDHGLARLFADCHQRDGEKKIVKCLIKKSRKQNYIIRGCDEVSRACDGIWGTKNDPRAFYDAPEGTVFADSVKVVST